MAEAEANAAKEPWVKVCIKPDGQVVISGEGWHNPIEIMTALSTAVAVLQQQMTQTARIIIPGTIPRMGPVGRS